jgi:hypothetical protein
MEASLLRIAPVTPAELSRDQIFGSRLSNGSDENAAPHRPVVL